MEIPAEVCGPRSVVREIHSAILRYFREIMKRMEVARVHYGMKGCAGGHFKKKKGRCDSDYARAGNGGGLNERSIKGEEGRIISGEGSRGRH